MRNIEIYQREPQITSDIFIIPKFKRIMQYNKVRIGRNIVEWAQSVTWGAHSSK